MLSKLWFSPMMMTTCLIGVLVCMLAAAMAAGPGDAAAAAAVKAVVTIPSAATTPICVIRFRFIGLPSPSLGGLSGYSETAGGYLQARLRMGAVLVRGRNKR